MEMCHLSQVGEIGVPLSRGEHTSKQLVAWFWPIGLGAVDVGQ